MKKLLSVGTLALFLFISATMIAQNNVNTNIGDEGNLFWKNTSPEVRADGSPYIDEMFKPISISKFENQPYLGRFNAYNGELEVKMNDGKVIALDLSGNYEVNFKLEQKTYKPVTYINDDSVTKRGFLVVIEDADKVKVFKKENIRYEEGFQATNSFERDRAAKFSRQDDEYYILVDGRVQFLPSKSKRIAKAFPKYSKKIKSYLKENKVDLDNDDHIVKLATYIQNL